MILFPHRQFVRSTPTPTVGQKRTGGVCKGGKGARACRGSLIDNILDWEHDLPDKDLDMALTHAWYSIFSTVEYFLLIKLIKLFNFKIKQFTVWLIST